MRDAEHEPHRVLVTGGAGFIGAHLVRHLLAVGGELRVVNLDLLTYAGDMQRLAGLEEDARLETVVGDVCDRGLVDRLLAEHEIDTVMHLAAESHVDRSIVSPGEFVRTNVVGTYTLLAACRDAWLGEAGVREGARFVHVSTDEVFGQLGPGDAPFSEATPYAPNSPYSASKAGADHLVRAYHYTYGLPVLTTYCGNNYGPGQHPEKFIPTVIRACLEEAPIPIYGDGSNVRDWVHVADHCRALERVLRQGRPGRTYAIGGENEQPNLAVARRICRLMDEFRPREAPHERLLTFVADRPGHDWRYAVDTRRVREELGWQPREAFGAGLRETVAWYLADREEARLTPRPAETF